jgi:sugar lactone lactonase YvrE
MTKVAPYLLWLPLFAACSTEAPTRPLVQRAETAEVRADVTASSRTVVMSGLDSPRGLAWGPEGGLYVAEAGGTAINGPCTAVVRGSNCYSGSGAITRLWRGKQERVATGLPSLFNPALADISGPQHLSFVGRGNLAVTIGWGGAPATRGGLGALGTLFGTLLAVTPSGQWRVVSDVSDFEGAENPAGGPIDSNPYGVLAEPGQTFVTDAGGNSLLRVAETGAVSLVATFPSVPVPAGPFNPPFAQSDAVPTDVVRGPDGALYVSTLTGAPFLPGAASIYRVVPGQSPQIYAAGFTMITDLDWGADGSLYVLQHASAPFFGGPGSVIRVAPGGARTTVATGLNRPAGLRVGPDGALYVSNNSAFADIGEVLRIVP